MYFYFLVNWNWILIEEVKRRIEGYKNDLTNVDSNPNVRERQTRPLRTENREEKRPERQRTNIYYNNFGEQFDLDEDYNDCEDFGQSDEDDAD